MVLQHRSNRLKLYQGNPALLLCPPLIRGHLSLCQKHSLSVSGCTFQQTHLLLLWNVTSMAQQVCTCRTQPLGQGNGIPLKPQVLVQPLDQGNGIPPKPQILLQLSACQHS